MTTATASRNGQATSRLFDPKQVAEAVRLIVEPANATELRVLEATTGADRWPHTATGYFNDADKLAGALRTIKTAKGIYITPNAVDPSLMARANNRLRKAGKGDSTQDSNITSRRWLLIDVDAQRPPGISSTDAEHQAAITQSQEIDLFLHNLGWPDPIAADSGNGAHLLYRIDLPADDGGLVKRCLEALAAEFDNGQVHVDTSVFNPARIWKLYGTLARKGDSTPDRPHRMARILNQPETPQIVPLELIEELAGMAPAETKQASKTTEPTGSSFDVDSFITRHGFDVAGPDPYQGGRRWTFNQSPLCEHHDDGPFLIQFANGALSAGCQHNSCGWNWHDLRAKFEPKNEREESKPGREQRKPVDKFSLGELTAAYPTLQAPVVDGLFREGEVVNVIAAPKIGKSWFGYGLAISIATGKTWLDRFETARGKVLLIDNELHRSTIAKRIPRVGDAMGQFRADYHSDFDVWPLRGNLRSLIELGRDFDEIEHGQYKLIILDAKYRLAVAGISENDNAAETLVYNMLDQYAEKTGAAFVLIHHTSKGSQSEKRVTDVGAGAGAQSRAADCHLVLREHEEDGVIVLSAAVRSFKPVEPLALRWEFPLWVPAVEIDPAKLKGKLSHKEQQQAERDKEGIDEILGVLIRGQATARKLRESTGISRERLQRLLELLLSKKQIASRETKSHGNICNEYFVPETTQRGRGR